MSKGDDIDAIIEGGLVWGRGGGDNSSKANNGKVKSKAKKPISQEHMAAAAPARKQNTENSAPTGRNDCLGDGHSTKMAPVKIRPEAMPSLRAEKKSSTWS